MHEDNSIPPGSLTRVQPDQGLLLFITKPRRDLGGRDFFCWVKIPPISTNERIFGVDAKQAMTLAIEFAKAMLEDIDPTVIATNDDPSST